MPLDLHDLPKIRDGLSFLYLEHGKVEQTAAGIEFFDAAGGRTLAPTAALAVLLLGPGTTVTHAAIMTMAEHGCLVAWAGEEGVRFYAQGFGETRKSCRLQRQAELVSDPARHAEVVLRMYRYRFGDELNAAMTLPEIRGHEGVRVRSAYATASRAYGVPWRGRRYDRSNWGAADPVNRALSTANACLHGLCHAAIVSAGYSPGLGFIHIGRQLSFVYDIADLYKAEVTIPLAFRMAAEGEDHLETRVRRACRDMFRESRLLSRIVPDIDMVLGIGDSIEPGESDAESDADILASLWPPLLAQGPREATNDGGHDP